MVKRTLPDEDDLQKFYFVGRDDNGNKQLYFNDNIISFENGWEENGWMEIDKFDGQNGEFIGTYLYGDDGYKFYLSNNIDW